MKIVAMIARLLLGLMFTVFGLNGFLHFIPAPMPPGVAGQFFGAIYVSHYYVVIFAVQTISGLLLLANRYVPLALVSLAAVIVNILSFHIFMMHAGLANAIVVGVLWLIVAWQNRQHLAGIFVQKSE